MMDEPLADARHPDGRDPPGGSPGEADLLLCVLELSGHDFRRYAPASRRRRIRRFLEKYALATPADAIRWIEADPVALESFVDAMTVQVSEMFRDPALFRLFRQSVVPVLHSHPRIRIWVAGCSTGEEVLSLAIMLHEEGLAGRTQIYATDLNSRSLQHARDRIFPVESIKVSTRNYLQAGGKASLNDYYLARYDQALFHESLLRQTYFARHNLATDGSPGEFTVIFCRNVLIYFDSELKHRVFDLFHHSLAPLGFLGLGDKEILRAPALSHRYRALDPKLRLYRREK